MQIGLNDVDSHNFTNLPLMKISAFHKKLGHQVEFMSLFSKYDIVYQSKIFDYTKDFNYFINANTIIKGGTGYGLDNTLPLEIEKCFPDYELYKVQEAYGFLSRGCPRNCGFCLVSKKEGLCSVKVADLGQFWSRQKEIKLLDPNLLACKEKNDLLQQLIDSKSWVDFTQGLDIRLMTEEIASRLNKIKVKMLHFAWDNMIDTDLIIKKLKEFKNYTKLNFRKLRVYVLTNYDTSLDEDLFRIYELRNLGYDPYLMVFKKWKAPIQILRMQRWVNNKFIFRSCQRFEDYSRK